MLKLLLIAPTCDGDDVGEAWVAYRWARGLAEMHDVTLLTYHKRGKRPTSEQLPGIRTIEWSEPPIVGRAERLNSMLKPGYIPFYVRARRWIKAALASGETFDVVHQPTPVAMRYPSPATGLGLPVVIGPVGGGLSAPSGFGDVDSTSPWFVRLRMLDAWRLRRDPLLRRTYSEAAHVLGIAPYVEERLADLPIRRFSTMSETAVDSLPDPVDRSTHTAPVRLLYVGRLVRTKGARDLITAMSLLADRDVALDIVGDGPDRAECEALAHTLRVVGRVTFHGWQDRSAVDRFYREADIFTFPSFREPGGNVVFEAMAHGLPLVVCRQGGPGSAVDDTGAIRIDATSPQKLAEDVADAIRTLVDDSHLRRQMGAAARDHLERTALWDVRLAQMSAVYESVRSVETVG